MGRRPLPQNTIRTKLVVMGMKVIAERVETFDDVTLLQRLECDEMQGFVWTKPLPFADLLTKLKVEEAFPLQKARN
jgi:EAL domain-containing protein (putative c-di-GMP-specific phosphodiesterase class I)